MERTEDRQESLKEPSSQTGEKRAGFTVVDKRPWAERLEGGTAEGTVEAPAEEPRYPSFVEELLDKLQEKDRKLKEFIASYKEEARRENEEFRQRLTREMERQLEVAKVGLIRGFLDVLDNLERALAHAAAQGFPEEGPSPGRESLLKGVESIRDQFLSVLRDLGAQRLSRRGQTFNPETDEALQVRAVDEAEKDNLVLEEIQPGYALNGKLIRPALVKVGRFSRG